MRRPGYVGPGAVVIAMLLGVAAAAQAQETFGRAKDYYASASYDDALRVLEVLRRDEPEATDVAAYEMLCLLALGREPQARTAAEAIVRHDPLYRPPADETSPRVRAFFEDVRRPLLPQVIRQLYADARAQLDGGDPETAATGFDRVVAVIDELAAHDDPGLTDLRLLAVGFRDLARATPSRESSAAAAGPVGAGGSARPEPSPAETGPVSAGPAKVYTAGDPGVRPPEVVSRELPPWNPISAIDRIRSYQGQLELLIDASGTVTAITIVRGVHADYDRPLVRAAAAWRFKPATLDGVAVPYRLLMDVVLAPQTP